MGARLRAAQRELSFLGLLSSQDERRPLHTQSANTHHVEQEMTNFKNQLRLYDEVYMLKREIETNLKMKEVTDVDD